jgi:hypothetical protein
MLAERLSPQTVNTYLSLLGAILNAAVDNDYLARSPWSARAAPAARPPPATGRAAPRWPWRWWQPAIAGRDLARFGLRFRHAPLPAAHPLPGGRAIALGRSPAQTAASIGRIHVGDAAAWEELDDTFGDGVVRLLHAGMMRWPLADGLRLRCRLGAGTSWNWSG